MKKPLPAPTADELMAAVHAAVAQPSDDLGVTCAEYARAHGISTSKARGILVRAVEKGILVQGYAYRPRGGDGYPYRQAVYRPVGT